MLLVLCCSDPCLLCYDFLPPCLSFQAESSQLTARCSACLEYLNCRPKGGLGAHSKPIPRVFLIFSIDSENVVASTAVPFVSLAVWKAYSAVRTVLTSLVTFWMPLLCDCLDFSGISPHLLSISSYSNPYGGSLGGPKTWPLAAFILSSRHNIKP